VGRFQKETDALVNDFNSSISFDSRLYKEDIAGSHRPRKDAGRLRHHIPEDAAAIDKGLREILADIEAGKVEFDRRQRGYPHEHGDAAHRAHRRRGQAPAHGPQPQRSGGARFPHVPAREIGNIIGEILALEKALCEKAEENRKAVIMPGYTHLQRAQPITFGQHLMAYAMPCSAAT
jgi:argininosuccinate lyase